MLKRLFAFPSDLLKPTSERLLFLSWLTPLLIIFSPFIVSFVTALPYALKVRTTPDQSPLALIAFVVPACTRITSDFLPITAVLLFLCTTFPIRVRIGQYLVASLALLFSILLVVALWSKLPMTNMMSIMFFVAYSGARASVRSPQFWVHFISAGGTALVLLNLVVIIGRRKTA
jgi:hypothetical protein